MILLRGIIIRAVGGFYDVQDDKGVIFRCRARGRLKKEGTGLLVGDGVEFTPFTGNEGVLEKVEPRRNLMRRPSVANVDQVIIVCAPQDPPLSLQLLDRLLVLAESQQMEAVICMNKDDLRQGEEELLRAIYQRSGYRLLFTSALHGHGMEQLTEVIRGRISVMAGPSGVGKSSLLNRLQPGLSLRTGEISGKIGRGKHTTRQVELITLHIGGLVADTPGFSQLDLTGISPKALPGYFPEFNTLAGQCRFRSCTHRNEPECAVKQAVQSGDIAASRYENYLIFYAEAEAEGRSY